MDEVRPDIKTGGEHPLAQDRRRDRDWRGMTRLELRSTTGSYRRLSLGRSGFGGRINCPHGEIPEGQITESCGREGCCGARSRRADAAANLVGIHRGVQETTW